MKVDGFCLSDNSGYTATLPQLGDWAVYAFRLGYEAFRFQEKETRCVTIASVPSREVFAPLVVLGALVGDAISFNGDGLLTWDGLLELEENSVVYFTDRNRRVKGSVGGFNSAFQAREIRDAKSVTHFVRQNNFKDYQISFESSKAKLRKSSDEALILDFFEHAFGISGLEEWFLTVYPKISLNTIKHRFAEIANDFDVDFDNKRLSLSSLLKLSENLSRGAGKILLKSEKNHSTVFDPKVSIIATLGFDKLIRQYASSDIVIILEHHEYDENAISVSRSLRSMGRDLPESLSFIDTPPAGVRAMSKVVQRKV